MARVIQEQCRIAPDGVIEIKALLPFTLNRYVFPD
jgi:hypothetical protein